MEVKNYLEKILKKVNNNGEINQRHLRLIAYSPYMAKKLNSTDATILLNQLMYWTGKEKNGDGWIYKTANEIYQETGLKRWRVDKAKKLLVKLGILEIKRKGVPAKLYFKVNFDALEKILSLDEACEEEGVSGNGNDLKGKTENNGESEKAEDLNLVPNGEHLQKETKTENQKEGKSMEDLIRKYYQQYVELKKKHFKMVEDDLGVYLNSEFLTMFAQKYRAHRELFMNFDETLKLVERTYVFLFGEVNFYWIIKNIDKIKLEKIMTRQNPIYATYMSMLEMVDGVEEDYLRIKKEYFRKFYKEFMFWIFSFSDRAKRFDYIDFKRDEVNEILLVSRNILSYDYIKALIEIKSRVEE